MFTQINMHNFRSFRDAKFDLRTTTKKPKPFIMVYGENGSGKSNFVSSFKFLKESILTLIQSDITDAYNDLDGHN
ncbi:MAG: AAA family ATPase, partial [Bacillota bacterium]|nr:AAA family ATPase [Bacillota bacterium]